MSEVPPFDPLEEPPVSGAPDDDGDNPGDERDDENEPPVRERDDRMEAPEEFVLDDEDGATGDEASGDEGKPEDDWTDLEDDET
jgi:hypothetical protein